MEKWMDVHVMLGKGLEMLIIFFFFSRSSIRQIEAVDKKLNFLIKQKKKKI